MALLKDEFRRMLSSRTLDLEIESPADLDSSLSIANNRLNSVLSADLPIVDEDNFVSSSVSQVYAFIRKLAVDASLHQLDVIPFSLFSPRLAFLSARATVVNCATIDELLPSTPLS